MVVQWLQTTQQRYLPPRTGDHNRDHYRYDARVVAVILAEAAFPLVFLLQVCRDATHSQAAVWSCLEQRPGVSRLGHPRRSLNYLFDTQSSRPLQYYSLTPSRQALERTALQSFSASLLSAP